MSIFKDEKKEETNLKVFTRKMINKLRFIMVILNLLLGLILILRGVPLAIIFLVNTVFILESYLKIRVAKNDTH